MKRKKKKKKNPAAVALAALRKTKSGGRNGGRPRIHPVKPPRLEPFDRTAHMAKVRAAKVALHQAHRDRIDLLERVIRDIREYASATLSAWNDYEEAVVGERISWLSGLSPGYEPNLQHVSDELQK